MGIKKGIKSLFKKAEAYRKSSHADVYERIAEKNKVEPQYVYEIAHGKKKMTPADHDIWYDLLNEGIVSFFWEKH